MQTYSILHEATDIDQAEFDMFDEAASRESKAPRSAVGLAYPPCLWLKTMELSPMES